MGYWLFAEKERIVSAKLVLLRKLTELEAAVAQRRLDAAKVHLRSLVAALFGAEDLDDVRWLLIEMSNLATELGMERLMSAWELDEMRKFVRVAKQSAGRLYG